MPIDAPLFDNVEQARQWVNLQSLGDAFHLVKVDYYEDFTLYEFYSYAEMLLDGGLDAFNVVEVWQ